MPFKCCVPYCRGNYRNGPRVHIFGFPKDTIMREKWIRSIPRAEFHPSATSKVCEAHFREEDIVKKISHYDSNTGKLITAPLDRPRLKEGAFPVLFPDCPAYLSDKKKHTREDPETKRCRLENMQLEKAINESITSKEKQESESSFRTYSEFLERIEKCKMLSVWTKIQQEDCIIFAVLNFSPGPSIVSSVMINKSLILSAYFKGSEIHECCSLKLPLSLQTINQLEIILEYMQSLEHKEGNLKSVHLSSVCKLIDQLANTLEDDKILLNFIKEQLNLLTVHKYHYSYSTEFLIFASLLYSISAHAYIFFRNSGNIILPHPSTIRKLCGNMKSTLNDEQDSSNFLKYLKEKRALLSEYEKHLILMVDEIYLKPFFDYKGGNLLGMAINSSQAATSAHVFMVSSLLSNYKDVIHIAPVKSVSAEFLHSLLKRILLELDSIGLSVFCVVTDNNSINRKMMSLFCQPPTLKIMYPHPADDSKPLFFCIDSVHILKSIRNNWINQKDSNQSMFFPKFDCFRENLSVETASFHTLKKLHELEYENLVKQGYGLTLKALTPTNLERQNVKLVLQIFNDYIVTALSEFAIKLNVPFASGTKSFIQLILNWWKIMNVKTPLKGVKLHDTFMFPLTTSENDERKFFLENFVDWLDAWKNMKCDTGTLTRETHSALFHTTHAILEITSYCIKDLRLSYFLPGKIQTDPLEERFGKYRNLAGSQFHVSVRQVFECESKLRLQNTIPLILNSSSFGKLEIKCFDLSNSNFQDNNKNLKMSENLKMIVIDKSNLQKFDAIIPVLTYLAGYCVYSLTQKLKCKECKMNLTIDKDIDLSEQNYIRLMDRGGLKYPHPDIVNIVMYNYAVIQKLVSPEYELDFLQVSNQREAVIFITLCQLNYELSHLDICESGHTIENIIKHILKMSTNAIMKNYCIKKNDVAKKQQSKRKLATLNAI